MATLTEVDSIEITVIVDNEVDPMSPYSHPDLHVSGQLRDVALASPADVQGRGVAHKEIRMDNLCCGAHGLSLMITAVSGTTRRTVLFDTGPEEDTWERNAQRLRLADRALADIDVIQLSHWHRDHSGGMLRAVRLITAAKRALATATPPPSQPLTVDVHPARPDYRGFALSTGEIASLEADPSVAEMEQAGAAVHQHAAAHALLGGAFVVSGEIPRVTAYETGLRGGMRFYAAAGGGGGGGGGSWEPDELIRDERFLMCKVRGKGLVVFTGCSHAGVVNVVRHAVQLAGPSTPLHAVVGGYHLVDGDADKVHDTVQDLKKLDPTVLLPGHCSGWRAKFEMERQMPGRLAPCTVGTKFVL